MSITALEKVKKYSRFRGRPGLHVVLQLLAECADVDGLDASIPHIRLAQLTKRSIRQTKRIIKQIIDSGEVLCFPKRGIYFETPSGTQRANLYHIVFQDGSNKELLESFFEVKVDIPGHNKNVTTSTKSVLTLNDKNVTTSNNKNVTTSNSQGGVKVVSKMSPPQEFSTGHDISSKFNEINSYEFGTIVANKNILNINKESIQRNSDKSTIHGDNVERGPSNTKIESLKKMSVKKINNVRERAKAQVFDAPHPEAAKKAIRVEFDEQSFLSALSSDNVINPVGNTNVDSPQNSDGLPSAGKDAQSGFYQPTLIGFPSEKKKRSERLKTPKSKSSVLLENIIVEICFLAKTPAERSVLTRERMAQVSLTLRKLQALEEVTVDKLFNFQKWWTKDYRSKNRENGSYRPPTLNQLAENWMIASNSSRPKVQNPVSNEEIAERVRQFMQQDSEKKLKRFKERLENEKNNSPKE